jgi:hypothetical protein
MYISNLQHGEACNLTYRNMRSFGSPWRTWSYISLCTTIMGSLPFAHMGSRPIDISYVVNTIVKFVTWPHVMNCILEYLSNTFNLALS